MVGARATRALSLSILRAGSASDYNVHGRWMNCFPPTGTLLAYEPLLISLVVGTMREAYARESHVDRKMSGTLN